MKLLTTTVVILVSTFNLPSVACAASEGLDPQIQVLPVVAVPVGVCDVPCTVVVESGVSIVGVVDVSVAVVGVQDVVDVDVPVVEACGVVDVGVASVGRTRNLSPGGVDVLATVVREQVLPVEVVQVVRNVDVRVVSTSVGREGVVEVAQSACPAVTTREEVRA